MVTDELWIPDPGRLRPVLDWVDSRFGPIRSLAALRPGFQSLSWYIFAIELARVPPGSLFARSPFTAAGASIDSIEALQKALGEAVERYSGLSAIEPQSVSMRQSEGELYGRFPVCASDEQCPATLRGVEPEVPITHAPMHRLADGRPVLVPAGSVHLNFRAKDEPMLVPPISTGLAFHHDVAEAVLAGLCEVIERDAIMLMWWTRSPSPMIRLDGNDIPCSIADRIARLESAGLSFQLFDITSDLKIPTVFCVIKNDRYPYVVVGAGCSRNPVSACAKAMDEAASLIVNLRKRVPKDLPSLTEFSWVRKLEDHAALFASGRLPPDSIDFLNEFDAFAFHEFLRKEWIEVQANMKRSIHPRAVVGRERPDRALERSHGTRGRNAGSCCESGCSGTDPALCGPQHPVAWNPALSESRWVRESASF